MNSRVDAAWQHMRRCIEIFLNSDTGKLARLKTGVRSEYSTRMSGQFFIVTTGAKGRSEYAALEDAVAALKGLLELQSARGYSSEKNPSGRYMSKHPEKPLVMFWIEDSTGKVVS
jgi:hypothetical protein